MTASPTSHTSWSGTPSGRRTAPVLAGDPGFGFVDVVERVDPQLARTLIEHDLVDELRLMVYPVVLGAGARLFGETSDKKPVRLVDTQTVGDGIAILTYELVRDAERASEGASLQDKRAAALRQAGIRESA